MAKQKGTPDRPYWSALEADGDTVRFRLKAERAKTKSPVHVDWVRFTVLRDNVEPPLGSVLFPKPPPDYSTLTIDEIELHIASKRLPIDDFDSADEFCATHEALALAQQVSDALGKNFTVSPDFKKGMDFYKHRFSIDLNGSECAWVGFLSASNSPHQSAQNKSLHVNIHGVACTFADSGWRDRIADLCDELKGKMTRVDLALDFFDGLPGGIEHINQQYKDGECNVSGRKLKCNLVGDWNNGHDRSLYIGSRDSGKITNIYEKGDQLYGHKFDSEWLRIELRYGNQVRVLSSDMLRRPADFFSGASDWHQAMLHKADLIVVPEPVVRNPRLPIETIKAECARSIKWLKSTAAASVSLAFQYLGETEFLQIVTNQNLPGRLSKFSREDIKKQMSSAFDLTSIFSVGSCPATT